MLNRDKYTFCANGGSCELVDAYSKDQVDLFLGEKSDLTHNHDGVYVKANASTNESIAIFNGINGEIKSSSATVDTAGNLTIVGKLTAGAITLPNIDGTAGQVLGTDGDGNTFWTSVESASGGIPAGGSSGQILVFDYSGHAKWGSVPAGDVSLNDITDVEIDGGTLTNDQQLVFDSSVYKWINKTVSSSGGGASTLNELSDVSTSSPTAKQYLGFDSVDNKWINMDSYSHPTGSGNNHVPAGGSSDQFLGYSSDGVASWQYLPTEHLVDLGDIDVDSPTSGQVLVYDTEDSVWKNETLTGSGDMLKSTYDTNDSGVVDNSEKVNNLTVETAVPSGAVFTDTTYSIGDGGLTEKNFTTDDRIKLNSIAPNANEYIHPTTSGNKHIPTGGSVGQILVNTADGTVEWQDNSGGSGASTLSDLTDTTISGIADEQILKYNATSSKWENVDIGQIYNLDGGNASSIYTQNNINGGNA